MRAESWSVCLPAVSLSAAKSSTCFHIGGPASRCWMQGWMDEVEQRWGRVQGSLGKLITPISQTGVLRLRTLKTLVLSHIASEWVLPKPRALPRQLTASWRDPGACVHICDPLLTAVNHTVHHASRRREHVPKLPLHQGFPALLAAPTGSLGLLSRKEQFDRPNLHLPRTFTSSLNCYNQTWIFVLT